ncbi:MAG: transporter substrate-binding domain-containing protein [Pseudomonadota bacterium]
MLNRFSALAAASFIALSGVGVATVAEAQSCGGVYTVQPGDSLSLIADQQYKDVGKWSAIYQSNVSVIGGQPERIFVGMKLNLTCIDGLPLGLTGGVDLEAVTSVSAPIQVPLGNAAVRAKINLLTADDYKPFTDRSLPGGGMYTEIVQATMEAAAPDEGFAIHWVNDWAAHHEPLLSNALLDLGFPWFKPDCDADPATYRCQNLVFSEPVFEVLSVMLVRSDSGFAYRSDADMAGRTLCRPSGYATFLFDQDGRNWLQDGVIELSMPGTIDDCFRLLVDGEVDGVVLNEFTGREKIKALELEGQVEVANGLPIAIDGLHVIAHKSHPDAVELMALVNDGLAEIKESGEYQRVIDEHMTRIWASF